jgi:hypothetical protein
MRIFKNLWFTRFAAKEDIVDGERTFYVYGFAKSNMGNICNNQLRDFKATAKVTFALPEKQLEEALKTGKYTEI